MASFSSSYSEDLTCSICLTIFSDPVTLHCGHSFCRECIRLSLGLQQQCPQCRTAIPTDRTDLTTNHILKSLAEKAKGAAELKREPGPDKEMAELCPEHEEKLKLFCITDQQLACIICRDGEKHEGHKFKPVKEAAASLRKELEKFVQSVVDDISAVESLAITQKQEIAKTREKSQQLTTQISSQFEEMHQFLREREDEIKKELKRKEREEIKKMKENFKAVEAVLSEDKALDEKVKSLLETSDPELFLKNWTEESSVKSAKSSFEPRGSNLKVLNTSLCLGPYESHLQFFVWKEMLQMIQPREEQLIVTNQSYPSNVSADGRSLLPARQQYQPAPRQNCYHCGRYSSRNYYVETTSEENTSALSTNQFSSGQHYWEIDVGQKSYWEVGIQTYFLKYDCGSYTVSDQNRYTQLSYAGRPRKIGTYLNVSSEQLSFYDADNMTCIHTMTLSNMSGVQYAYLNADTNEDYAPITVCWY